MQLEFREHADHLCKIDHMLLLSRVLKRLSSLRLHLKFRCRPYTSKLQAVVTMVPTTSPIIDGTTMTTEFRARSPLREPLLVDDDKAAVQPQVTTESLDIGSTHRLLLYSEIPSWQQENEYILTGYRYVITQSWELGI